MLSNFLTYNFKKVNAKHFVGLLSKKIYFFDFKFTKAKLLRNCFWHNLIVYNSIWGRHW